MAFGDFCIRSDVKQLAEAGFRIAGICNLDGNVLGMMPHPERAVYRIQDADRTRGNNRESGDGKIIFDSIADYVNRKGL